MSCNERERLRILVADDEPVVRDLCDKFLQKAGYEVTAVPDGAQALEKVRSGQFDMLILDLKMPKVEGMEVLDKIRLVNKDLLIIVITGFATVDTAKKAMQQGCFDYITKPFNIEEVGFIIKRAFEVKKWAKDNKCLQEQIWIAERDVLLLAMGADTIKSINSTLGVIKFSFAALRSAFPEIHDDNESVRMIVEQIGRIEKLIEKYLLLIRA